MFQTACELIFPCLCNVGGCSAGGRGTMFGLGCWVGEQYVITAKHVVDRGIETLGQAAVGANDGLWSSHVEFESAESDITLLKVEKKLKPGFEGCNPPSKFPGIGGHKLTHGLSVGYFSRLHRTDRTGTNTSHTYFASASLSFFTRDIFRWALSAGFAEEGFSGSPVFSSGGMLVGVLTEIMSLAQPHVGRLPQLVTVPMMSPLRAPLVEEIAKAARVFIRE